MSNQSRIQSLRSLKTAVAVASLLAQAPLVHAGSTNPCDQLSEAGWKQVAMWRTQELCLLHRRLHGGEAAVPVLHGAQVHIDVHALVVPSPGTVVRDAPAGDDYRADTWLNLRSGPGVDHGVVGRAKQDEALITTGLRAGDWWQVQYRAPGAGQVTGWVFSQWIRRRAE